MAKIKRPPKGVWKIGDVATFGGIVGRIVANDPLLGGGYPLYWITTEPGVDFGSTERKGMLVRFDLEGKFQSWHKDPLLYYVRRPTRKELDLLRTAAKIQSAIAANPPKETSNDNSNSTPDAGTPSDPTTL